MRLSRFFGTRDLRSARRPTPRRSPMTEVLERRELLTPFTVYNNHDSGPGSLRAAITSSNLVSGTATNTINFQIASSGGVTISLLAPLDISHSVTINGTTEPDTGTAPRIVIDGGNSAFSNPNSADIAGINVRAPHTTIEGLAIDDFMHGEYGISIYGDDSSEDVITDNYIGLTAAGAQAGNSGGGLLLCIGTHNNTISGNVISCNSHVGLEIHGGSSLNTVQGNLIGTNPAGTAAVGNGTAGVGVIITMGSFNNLIGGTTLSEGNIIAGNAGAGIQIDSDSYSNDVEGNFIGTNASGAAGLGNGNNGVLIESGAADNVIGGTAKGDGNTIENNQGHAVLVLDTAGSGNVVVDNII